VLDWQAGGCDEKCDRAQRVRHRRGSVRPAMGPHDNRGAFDVGDVLHSASWSHKRSGTSWRTPS